MSRLTTEHPELIETDLRREGHPRLRFTPLVLAAAQGQYAICSNLIVGGANVNVQEGHGYTALHLAAHWSAGNKDTNLVLLLIQHGADATIKNYDVGRHTALWVATNNPLCSESLKQMLLTAMAKGTN